MFWVALLVTLPASVGLPAGRFAVAWESILPLSAVLESTYILGVALAVFISSSEEWILVSRHCCRAPSVVAPIEHFLFSLFIRWHFLAARFVLARSCCHWSVLVATCPSSCLVLS